MLATYIHCISIIRRIDERCLFVNMMMMMMLLLLASLGRISAANPENYTHALYMRFQGKEYLEKFYHNPFYLKVLDDHVMTYCHVCTNM